jgi:hypothetical protein
MDNQIGDRVGAILSATKDRIELLGYGVYMGDEIPPESAGGFNLGFPNPKIQLDSGDIVWGCECWWGPQETIEARVAMYSEVVTVSIHDARKS